MHEMSCSAGRSKMAGMVSALKGDNNKLWCNEDTLLLELFRLWEMMEDSLSEILSCGLIGKLVADRTDKSSGESWLIITVSMMGLI